MAIRNLLIVLAINLGLTVVTIGSGTGLGFLSPLVPVAAITGHSGILALGLTGAALLKLKAAAALGTYLSRRSSRSHHHHHHKETYHGWRDEGVEYGWRRKRSLDANTYSDKPVTQFDEFNPSLDEVLQYDQLGCGLRLVCELAATPQESLLDDERLILGLFGNGDEKLPNPSKTSRGKLNYSYASILGSHSRDMEVCSKVYGKCPYTARQVMQSLRDANL